jgi:hypothetical protein
LSRKLHSDAKGQKGQGYFCPFAALLAEVASYAIDSSGLHLSFADNGGKMNFQAAK